MLKAKHHQLMVEARELRYTLFAVFHKKEDWLLKAYEADYYWPTEAVEQLTEGKSWEEVSDFLREERDSLPKNLR